MFDFSVATTIDCPPQRVWNYLVDVRRWWLPSNPEHESLEIVGPGDEIALGTKLRVRERIAGIPGEAMGTITEFVPGECATWEASARYRLWRQELSVEEGVTWSIRRLERGTELAAHVWARFPDTALAKAFEWLFIHVFRGIAKDRRHAETELAYIRAELEKRSGERPA